MYRVLLIERSATLSHVLSKYLVGKACDGCDVEVIDDYDDGRQSLLRTNSKDGSDSVVILGWPTHTDPSADELLSLLEQADFRNQSVVVMAHEADPAIRGWVAQRPRTAFILWDNFTETSDSLKRLMSVSADTEAVPLIGKPTTQQPIRILFVDDSPSMRVYYRRLLNREGYTTDTASCVDEALDKVHKKKFDIAIIDYFMPDANGDVLCRRLHESPATTTITTAILTGTYSDKVIKDCLEAGATECMFKNEAEELFLARITAMGRAIQIKQHIESERYRLESILMSVGDGVYGVDKSGRINFINPAARRTLGFDHEEQLVGESPHALFHHSHKDGTPNPSEMCLLQQAYGSGDKLQCRETVFWHKNKKSVPVECAVHPLHIHGQYEGSVVAFRDISERKSLEEKLKWQATHDPLTELLNRRYFEEQLEKEVKRLQRTDEKSALLYIDLDRFKYINDTIGHSIGDKLLVATGHQLRSRLRETDTLARLGGDEFAIILRNMNSDSLLEIAETFRHVINEYDFDYNGKHYKTHGTVGAAIIDRHSRSPGEVLANADIACNIAKRKGRNQTHIYTPESDVKLDMDMDLGWSARLREALNEDKLLLHYQPIIPTMGLNIDTLPSGEGKLWDQFSSCPDNICCYEVLLRLQGDNGEIIPPDAFIPTAERFNMMQEIDFWVIEHAIAKLAEINAGHNKVTFSINLSGHTIGHDGLVGFVKGVIGKYSVDPQSLYFEITETAAIDCLDSANQLISELKAVGCRFALDDFGSGFSSFGHLKHLPVDIIKIDGMFVQGIVDDPIDRAMVRSMNDIAHSLGRPTIAEYVENAEIMKLLIEYGVDYLQGFYISRPLEKLELADISTPVLEQQV